MTYPLVGLSDQQPRPIVKHDLGGETRALQHRILFCCAHANPAGAGHHKYDSNICACAPMRIACKGVAML